GKGHAALASGDYQSAAVYLLRGFERFPALTRFKIDLESLLGGGEIVDIRRADLMRLLQANDDPRLRFLLGYLEVYGGHRESGLEHLRAAADGAPFGSILRRFADMVAGEEPPPPPSLPATPPRETIPATGDGAPDAAGRPETRPAGVEP
ncbi:MAG: hypothetical protein D6744_09495, partial [Planctomycetota bacterium]